MASTSQTPDEGNNVVSETLGGLIMALDIAKGACTVPLAQLALGSASALLTTIRVRFFLFRESEPLVHTDLGHDGQPGGLR